MPVDRVNVLVLYSSPLLGRGLERILGEDGSLTLRVVDVACEDEVAEALTTEPVVVVLEEGGRLGILDVLRRSTCPVVIDVSLERSDVWTLHRDRMLPGPDDVVRRIRAACRTGTADVGRRKGPPQTVPVPG